MKEKLIRYSNRKTYSTTQKKYVKLTELLQKLKSNEEFEIVEHGTGVDITDKVMCQAMANSGLTIAQIKKALA
jgi:polyhydroxyalkanoate synthesis regulator protein